MNFIKIGVLWFLIWSIIATFFAPENYQILNHLMSDLSTVKHPYPFIMDTGFYGFSVFACMSAYVLYQKKQTPQIIILLIAMSAISMSLIAVFDTNYPMSDVVVTSRGISLHAFFAASQEGLFVLLITYHILNSMKPYKTVHIIFLTTSLLLSFIFILNIYPGLFQRLIFINNGIWLFTYFQKFKQKSATSALIQN